MLEVPASHSKIVKDEETGEEHPLREYKLIQVGQLRCLLVHDRHSEKAALSTTIGAGQLHDGADWPGRAHLLEHLLFLGSKAFPKENELDSWLTQHGGHSVSTRNTKNDVQIPERKRISRVVLTQYCHH